MSSQTDISQNQKFKGYEKMSEYSTHWELTPTDQKRIKQTKWVVTEKVHGSNFCWALNSNSVIGANRLEILEEDRDFFNWQLLKVQLEGKLRTLWNLIVSSPINSEQTIQSIYVFGEICGGTYPNTPSPQGVHAVQTGIYYSPQIEFVAFDIAIESTTIPRTYLNIDVALSFLKSSEIFAVEPLFIGSYTDAVNFNPRFESHISTRLGYPKVPGNLAEGIVVKPNESFLVNTSRGMTRPVLKIKIPEFLEDKRFHSAEKWQMPTKQFDTSTVDHDALVADLHYEIESRITTQRIDNAISKFGHVSPQDKESMRKLLEMYITDILDEIRVDYFSAEYSQLNPEEKQELEITTRKAAISLFRTHFQIKKETNATSSGSN